MRINQMRQWSGANWFVLLLPLLACGFYFFGRSVAPGGDTMEAALLIDACLGIPLLYLLCYGSQLPWWQLALRMIGLACGGIYLLSWIVPPEAQHLLPQFVIARWVGLAVIIGFELWLLVLMLRLVFRAGTTAEDIQAAGGVPPWIAKLMLLEVRFWKWVARLFRGR